MKISNLQPRKRLALFTFYEKEGIARRYVLRYLKGLQEIAERVVLIANGKLTEFSRREIEALGVEILQRENSGFDFAAWNYAIQGLGWMEIRSYDELILCNCSCYAVHSFSEIFERMDKEHPEVDFWGLTNHLENKTVRIIPEIEDSWIREHIQSYFLVLKKPVLQSTGFQNYWMDFKPCSTFAEEVYEHETKFTEFLSENGFQWSVAYPADGDDWDSTYYNCLENVRNRCPVAKRKLFSIAPLDWEAFTEGDVPSRLLRYLDSIGYPVGEIYEDLLATQLLSRINRNLHLTYCVSDEVTLPKNQDIPKVALIFFSYYEDSASRYLSYIKNFPEFVDIFIVLKSSQNSDRYRKLFSVLPNRVEYRIKKSNKGRDFAAYMIECREVFEHYDIVCCTKDKKSPQNGFYVAKSFDEHCWKNVAYSRGYINGVINLFLRNERLGLVIPPVPDFGLFCTLGAECCLNEKEFKNLWTELNLRVPYEDAEIAPFGSMFWVRSKATQTIRSKIWTYADMPREPLPQDGSLLHSLERMWAYGAQNDGFYTLTCFPLALSNAYYGLSTQHLKEVRREIFNRFCVCNHRDLVLKFDSIICPLPPQSQTRKEIAAQVNFGLLFKAFRYYLRSRYAWTHLRRVYYQEKLKKLFDAL